MLNLGDIRKFMDAVEAWCDGTGELWDIANVLDEPVAKLQLLFQFNGLYGDDGCGENRPSVEEVYLVICLYYALRKEKGFKVSGLLAGLIDWTE
jgi:hypothetical protein